MHIHLTLTKHDKATECNFFLNRYRNREEEEWILCKIISKEKTAKRACSPCPRLRLAPVAVVEACFTLLAALSVNQTKYDG